MTKIMVKDRVGDYELSDLYDDSWMTLAEFKERMCGMNEEYGFLDSDIVYISSDNSLCVLRERLETDAECAKRLKRESFAKHQVDRAKAIKAEKELALYNKLKAKYD